MNKPLRITGCLFAALAFSMVFSVASALEELPDGSWLHIGTLPDAKNARIKPEQTVIYTTAKPKVIQVSDSRWMITFSSTF